MKTMKVTVCELRNDPEGLDWDWTALVAHVKSEKSDLVRKGKTGLYSRSMRGNQGGFSDLYGVVVF